MENDSQSTLISLTAISGTANNFPCHTKYQNETLLNTNPRSLNYSSGVIPNLNSLIANSCVCQFESACSVGNYYFIYFLLHNLSISSISLPSVNDLSIIDFLFHQRDLKDIDKSKRKQLLLLVEHYHKITAYRLGVSIDKTTGLHEAIALLAEINFSRVLNENQKLLEIEERRKVVYCILEFLPRSQLLARWGDSNTILHLAVLTSDASLITHLITLGLDPTIRNAYNQTPRDIVSLIAEPLRSATLTEMLIEFSPTIKRQSPVEEVDRWKSLPKRRRSNGNVHSVLVLEDMNEVEHDVEMVQGRTSLSTYSQTYQSTIENSPYCLLAPIKYAQAHNPSILLNKTVSLLTTSCPKPSQPHIPQNPLQSQLLVVDQALIYLGNIDLA
ncbi:hypothetical protein HK096_007159 [Nowakowskiella sp. JEL0078]|nr:hypothetical protein HK096_007159 [Nowakowskiella sp. JEL0078]